MKINWKVRLRSGSFWAGTVAALLVFLYALANMLGITPPVEQGELSNVLMLFLALLAAVGVISDPTTPGLGDSSRAMGYDRPGHPPENAT